MNNVELLHRWDAVMMRNYGTPPLALVRGSGCRVWDADGREYLDLVAGIAVNTLGHAHPAIVAAVTDQVATLGHVSNLAAHERGIALAEHVVVDAVKHEDLHGFLLHQGLNDTAILAPT